VATLKIKTIGLMALVLLVVTSNTALSQSFTSAQGYLGPNLYFKIEAPVEVSVNDTVSLKITLKVYNSNLSAARITVWIYDCGVDEQYTLFRNQLIPANTEQAFTYTVKPAREGYLKLTIEAEYYYVGNGVQYEYSYISLAVTAVRNMTYRDLYNNYTSLLSEHSSLLREYTYLESEYNKLLEEHTLLLDLYENLTWAYVNLSQNYSSLLSMVTQLVGSKSSTDSTKTQTQQSTVATAVIATGLIAVLAVLTRPWRLLKPEKRGWWFT
jgi:hypothetical protein